MRWLLLALLLASSAYAQQPPIIQNVNQFKPSICSSTALQSVRVDATGSFFECFTPASSTSDITGVGDCSSGECFNASGTGNSLVFEGSSADSIETTLTAADPTVSDKTITLPNETGTVCTTGSVCTGYAASTSDITAVGDCSSGACFVDGGSGTTITFEGATPDANEIFLTSADPAADRTITLPNETGTVCLRSSTLCGFIASFSVASDSGTATITDGDALSILGGAGIITSRSSDDITIATRSSEAGFIRDLLNGATCGAGTAGSMALEDNGTYISYCDDTATPVERYIAHGTASDVGIAALNAGTWAVVDGTAAGLGSYITSETGTGGMVFKDSPSFTTQITTPRIYGGTSADGDLQIDTTTDSDFGTISIQPGATSIGNELQPLIATKQNIAFTNANAVIYAYEAGGDGATRAVWTLNQDMTATSGGLLFAFFPQIQNEGTETLTNGGAWAALYSNPNLNCNTDNATTTCTYSSFRTVSHIPRLTRDQGAYTVTTLSESAAVYDQPVLGPRTLITERSGLRFLDRSVISGSPVITTQYAVYVADLTVGTLAAGLYSDMSSGTGKYVLYGAGTAASVLNGALSVRQGSTTDLAAVGGTINYSVSQVCNSNTGDDALQTYTLPASTLGVSGDIAEFRAGGTIKNDADQKRIRLKLGTSTVLDTGATGITTSKAFDWVALTTCTRVGATTARCMSTLELYDSTTPSHQTYADYVEVTETLGNALAFGVYGENSAASSDDICSETFAVQWRPSNT